MHKKSLTHRRRLNVHNETSSPLTKTGTTTRASISSTLLPNQTALHNGTGNACQDQFDKWTSDWLWGWNPETQVTSVYSYTEDYFSTLYSTDVYNCTQTCGSICYAGPITPVISRTHISHVKTRTFVDLPEYTVPRPSCTIQENDCLSLQTSWSSAISSFSALPPESQITMFEPWQPDCSACVPSACTFLGMFGMSLYYWPVTTSVSRDYCASEPANGPATGYNPDVNHTYIPITTGPYAIVDGITMYEGNVYVSFDEPRVEDECGNPITRETPGPNVITIASEHLHSIRKFPHALAAFPVTWDLVPYPINYDDFNPPTPFSAYAGMRECAQEGWDHSSCTIVKPGEYWPYMLMPPQIRDLDPNWKSCHYDRYAVFDPPIALHTRPNMFSTVDARPTSTRHAHPVHTPPTPGQSVGDGIPVATTKSEMPKPSSDGEDQHNSEGTPKSPKASTRPTMSRPGPKNPTETAPPSNVGPPAITIGSSVFPIDASGGLVVRPAQSFTDDAVPITIDGIVFSLGPVGLVIASAGKTSTVSALSGALGGSQAITIGSSVMTIDLVDGSMVCPGLTLHNGDPPITVNGVKMSVGTSGVVLVDEGGTTIVPIPDADADQQQVVTIGSAVYTVTNGRLVLGPGTTLSVSGAAAVVAGATISLAPEGVVVESASRESTIAFESSSSEETARSTSRILSLVLDSPFATQSSTSAAAPLKVWWKQHITCLVAAIITIIIFDIF